MHWIVTAVVNERGLPGLLSLLAWAATAGVTLRAGKATHSLLRVRLLPALEARKVARRLKRMPGLSAAAELTRGQAAHLRGQVEACAASWAEYSGLPAVVCKHACGAHGGDLLGEGLAAHDFVLRLRDGTAVCVEARDAANSERLEIRDGAPHFWEGQVPEGGWFRESRVAPGDEIEVAGLADSRIDPHAPRLSDRQEPLAWTLSAGAGSLLLSFATRLPGPATTALTSAADPSSPWPSHQ